MELRTSTHSPATSGERPRLDGNALDRLISSAERMRAVEKSAMLDAPAEEDFDVATRLAVRLLQVPVSYVSIIDQQRDFFATQHGLPAPLSVLRQNTGRTFCHYVLESDEPLVVFDALQHPVLAVLQSVQAMGARSYVGVPLKLDGQIIGTFCVVDMRPRSWSSSEVEILQQLARSVGREIALRCAAATARREAEHALALARSREEIVAIVAHDLRTPLQVLELSMALLQRGLKREHDPAMKRMTTAINSIKHMADALMTSHAAKSGVDVMKRAIAATDLLAAAVDMMRPIAEREQIALDIGEVDAATLFIDYAQMLRALGNLIGNSLKYSAPGTRVVVSARGQVDTLLLCVSDQGKGMSIGDQARAFDSGWQGDEGMVRGDGAGLGLAIVKKLAQANGGQVAIASELGMGTTVSITLPRQ